MATSTVYTEVKRSTCLQQRRNHLCPVTLENECQLL